MKRMKHARAAGAFALACIAAPAAADLHTYLITTVNPDGRSSTATIHEYKMRRPYKVRAVALRSGSMNLAEAASERKHFPLAVSGGGFTASSDPVGLIAVGGNFVSRVGSIQALPILVCFTPTGARVTRMTADTTDRLDSIAGECEAAAIQAMAPMVAGGRRARTEVKPLSWEHVFFAQGGKWDAIVVVEGTISAAALTAFVATTGSPCTVGVGRHTTQRVTIQVAAGGSADVTCSLQATSLIPLNLGSQTGAIHYQIPFAGDEAATPPVALFFDD